MAVKWMKTLIFAIFAIHFAEANLLVTNKTYRQMEARLRRLRKQKQIKASEARCSESFDSFWSGFATGSLLRRDANKKKKRLSNSNNIERMLRKMKSLVDIKKLRFKDSTQLSKSLIKMKRAFSKNGDIFDDKQSRNLRDNDMTQALSVGKYKPSLNSSAAFFSGLFLGKNRKKLCDEETLSDLSDEKAFLPFARMIQNINQKFRNKKKYDLANIAKFVKKERQRGLHEYRLTEALLRSNGF